MADIETDFDFGFTVVDEEELAVVTEIQAEKEKVERKVTLASSEKEKLDNKINSLYNMFQPLLNNLASNPEKEYIFWPNRLTKIEEFRDKIDAVYKGQIMANFLHNVIAGIDNTSVASDGVSSSEFTGTIDTGSYILNAALSGSLYGGVPNSKITTWD